MYQAQIIKDELRNLCGWEQGKTNIAESLTTTESGILFQSQHPLLTLTNLRAFADTEGYNYDAYNAETDYVIGNKVTHDDVIYRSIKASKAVTPVVGEYWELWDDFSEWLERETGSAIVKAVQAFINEKIASNSSRGTVANFHLFTKADVMQSIDNDSKFVGFELWASRVYGVLSKIKRISFCFEGPTDVNLKIFHTSGKLPIIEKTYNYTKTGEVQWFTEDIDLPGTDNIGGMWIMGYEQGEVKALNAYESINENRFLKAIPFEAEPSASLWDVSTNIHTELTYGMNVQISAAVDMTSFIVDENQAFQDLIAKAVAVHFLRIMAYNPEVRINRNESNIRRTEILYEIDGDSGSLKKSGLAYEYQLVMKSIIIDTGKLDSLVTRKQKGRLKYGTR